MIYWKHQKAYCINNWEKWISTHTRRRRPEVGWCPWPGTPAGCRTRSWTPSPRCPRSQPRPLRGSAVLCSVLFPTHRRQWGLCWYWQAGAGRSGHHCAVQSKSVPVPVPGRCTPHYLQSLQTESADSSSASKARYIQFRPTELTMLRTGLTMEILVSAT